MPNPGFEWPAPDGPKCGALAEDLETGEQFSCLLRLGHQQLEHHWQKVEGDQLRACSWIGGRRVTTFVREKARDA